MLRKNNKTVLATANIKFSQGDFKGSLKLYEEYVNKTKEKDLIYLSVLQNIGVCNKKLSNIDIALEYYRQALDLSRNLNSKEEEASALSNVAVILKNQGAEMFKAGKIKESYEKFSEAEELFDQATEIDLETENYNGVASDLLNLGNLYKTRLENSKAIAAFNRCIVYSKKTNNLRTIGSAICGIGNIHLLVGEYDEAIEKYQAALEILVASSQYDTQWLTNLTQENIRKAKELKRGNN
ncbi:MAG: hypothetical protein MI685_02805 [Chlorobiales bacterium]|nr:hypothetical protein [Chlorobiales bacterium]